MNKAIFLIVLLLADSARAADLNIIILEGDGAFNNIKRRYGRDIRVEVRDDRDAPVADAEVTFTAPAFGAGATFNKQSEFRTRTDTRGQATTSGLTPNATEGRFNIRVTATSQGRTGSTVVAQSNTLAGGIGAAPNTSSKQDGSRGKKALLFTILGGAAAGGIIFATRGGGNDSSGSSGGPPVSLSVGTVSVGGPR